MPTDVGSYTMRVYGTIEGKPVDAGASSGPDSFDAVQPASNLGFPGTNAAGSTNVEPQLAALRDQIDAASRTASTARWIGLAGVILGVVGIVLGGVLGLVRLDVTLLREGFDPVETVFALTAGTRGP